VSQWMFGQKFRQVVYATADGTKTTIPTTVVGTLWTTKLIRVLLVGTHLKRLPGMHYSSVRNVFSRIMIGRGSTVQLFVVVAE